MMELNARLGRVACSPRRNAPSYRTASLALIERWFGIQDDVFYWKIIIIIILFWANDRRSRAIVSLAPRMKWPLLETNRKCYLSYQTVPELRRMYTQMVIECEKKKRVRQSKLRYRRTHTDWVEWIGGECWRRLFNRASSRCFALVIGALHLEDERSIKWMVIMSCWPA